MKGGSAPWLGLFVVTLTGLGIALSGATPGEWLASTILLSILAWLCRTALRRTGAG